MRFAQLHLLESVNKYEASVSTSTHIKCFDELGFLCSSVLVNIAYSWLISSAYNRGKLMAGLKLTIDLMPRMATVVAGVPGF